jgi:TetR/AcrR family transcriptional regulator, transcriptional repressor for nem operon
MGRTKLFSKNEALTKARDLFWRKGYHATSAQDLVDELGINRSSLYDTFGDKRQLFLQTIEQYRTEMAAFRQRLFQEHKSAESAIKTMFRMAIQESLSDKDNRGCFLVNTATELAAEDPDIQKMIDENRKNVENEFLALVKKGQLSGEISSKHSARALARFLFNTYTGIKVLAKSSPDKSVYEDILSVTLKTLLQE